MTNVHTSDSEGNENTISYHQFMVDMWEHNDETQHDITDLRTIDGVTILVDNPDDDQPNPRLTYVVGDMSYTPLNAFIDTHKHWPAQDSHEYSCVVEVAIGLIAAGYGAADAEMPDDTGTSVSEDLQTNLMDTMFRSKAMYEMLSKMEQLLTGAVMAAIHEEQRTVIEAVVAPDIDGLCAHERCGYGDCSYIQAGGFVGGLPVCNHHLNHNCRKGD